MVKEKNSRGFGVSTKRKTIWVGGCCLNFGISVFKMGGTCLRSTQRSLQMWLCFFSAIQFYPWLSRERSCTSGNTGYSTEISITVNSCWSGVALSTWLWQTPAQGSSSQPQYCWWLLPQWRCCSLSDVRVKCWGRNLDAHRASSAV